MITGFGKNMRNILLALHDDPEFEVVESANGIPVGRDAKTPWKCYGTAPTSPALIASIRGDSQKERAAAYGFYTIDEIVKEVQPDIYLGIEDIWAFNGFLETKPWWNTTRKIIWTTLDSLPILEESYRVAKYSDKFLVWASFAEEEMKKRGAPVETIHGAIDYSNFKPLDNRKDFRKKFNLDDSFVIGFVFKNQLRKSVPNLLDGFKLFREKHPESNAKLLLHTDWADQVHGWNIPQYLKEKGLTNGEVLATYACESCRNFAILPFGGPEKDCPFCGAKNTFKTKTHNHGLTEEQLNVVYNCMDVYCHPFTSGGQELPIQEAKAAGLVTLVTEYSCGTDSCYPEQGGLPLKWNEYREPHSQFIKASTCPQSICENLDKVYKMGESEKEIVIQSGQKWVKQEFSVEQVVEKLKKVFREVMAKPITTIEQKSLPQTPTPFESLLDGKKEERILFVMPESEYDVFVSTSLLPSIAKLYPDKQIYFATKPQNKEILIGNPYIYKILDFHPNMENLLMMEGQADHEGYFEICYLPHLGTQRQIDFVHNGKDKIELELQ